MIDPTPDAGATEAGAGPGPGTCECPEPPDPYVPPEPLVVESACDVRVGNNLSGQLYAEIDRPNLAEEKLFMGVPVFTYGEDQAQRPVGYRSVAGSGLWVQESTVGVACGSYGTGSPPPPVSVRFIFPR